MNRHSRTFRTPPQMGIVHRDLRPENVLLSSDSAAAVVKLTGFGRASPLAAVEADCGPTGAGKSEASPGVAQVTAAPSGRAALEGSVGGGGDPRYMAPEVAAGRAHGPAADAWACGVILFRLLSGEVPFEGATPQEVLDAVRGPLDAAFSHPVWWNASQEAIDLVSHLLHKDPAARMRVEEVLSHEWMVKHAEGTARPLEISRTLSFDSIAGAARLAALDRQRVDASWSAAIASASAVATRQERQALLRRRASLDPSAMAAIKAAAAPGPPEAAVDASAGSGCHCCWAGDSARSHRERGRDLSKDPVLRSILAAALEAHFEVGASALSSPTSARSCRDLRSIAPLALHTLRDIQATN